MGKRKAAGSNETRKKIAKSTETVNARLCLEAPVSLKNSAATQVAIALWFHLNVRNLTRKYGYNAPWNNGESSEEDGNSADESDGGESDQISNSSNEPDDVYEDKREYQSYYDCYREEHENDFSWDELQSKVTRNASKLPAPSTIQDIVEEKIEPIMKNFKKWVMYNHKRIFFTNHMNYVYGLVDEVIWQNDGQVDFEKTARNLLDSPRVNEIEKYRLICTYCIEDKIKNVSPRLFSNKYIERVLFNGQPMIYYWNSYAQGKVNEIPSGDFKSINSRMLATKHADNKSAMRYFWNRLTEKEKLECAKSLIQRFGVKHQNFLLSHLNDVQQHHFLLEMGAIIVKNYAQKSSMSKYAIPTWKHLQNLLNSEQLSKIIFDLLEFAWDPYNEKYDRTYVISLLRNLWRNASNQVKNFSLDYQEKKIFNLLLKGDRRPRTKYDARRGRSPKCTNLDENFMLLCDVLADANTILKEEILQSEDWRDYHQLLTKKGETELLNYFIKSCLPKSNDKANELKRNMLKSDESINRCLNLLKQKKINELDQFLSSYLPDARSIADFKTDLMLSEKGIATFVQTFTIDSYKSLHTLVNQVIKQSDSAVDLKRKIISSVTRQLCDWIENGNLGNVIDCLQLFLCEENDMKMAKETLLQSYRSEEIYKVFIHYDETQWQSFMLWCLYSDEYVSKFKEALPFDGIFTRLLQHSVFTHYDSNSNKCKFRSELNFTELDRFLRWFFITADDVKKFKIEQVMDYKKMDILNMLSRKKDDSFLKSVLNWFFDGDNEKIQLFKSKYKKLKIANVI